MQFINGKPNPRYVDVLDVDEPIAGQEWAVVSVILPEQILKQKNIYFFEQFLKTWDFKKSMEKFFQFLNFISFKYNLSFDDLSKDFNEFVEEERDNLVKSSLDDDYKTFLDNHEKELQEKFTAAHNFQTNVRGIKMRGNFPSKPEAELRAKLLREVDDKHDLHILPVGTWIPVDIDGNKSERVEYLEPELNQLMHEKNKNDAAAKVAFEQRRREQKQQAIEENIKKAEKTGNVLSQTIDENGNLVGVNGVNTQEFSLRENQTVSTDDIRATLFEGEDIVVGKTDNGQSLLKSGPFASK